jgi:hypothetical protein
MRSQYKDFNFEYILINLPRECIQTVYKIGDEKPESLKPCYYKYNIPSYYNQLRRVLPIKSENASFFPNSSLNE